MKKKCDKCDDAATHHSVEIIKGDKIEKHLCDEHAKEEGLAVKPAHTPINELLTHFVKAQGGTKPQEELVCDDCELAYSEFRENTLLGCPTCYAAFEAPLGLLLERAHEGATHHIGKVPSRAGEREKRQQHVLRMRKRLDDAVRNEDYELAARLRDEIRRAEEEVE